MKKKRLLLLLFSLIWIIAIGIVVMKKPSVKTLQVFSQFGFWETPVLEEANCKQAYENVLCSAVRIQGNGHYGSGNIYCMTEDEIVIVTGGHVLTYFDEGSYVTFFDGKTASGRVLGIDETADVSFVGISIDSFTYEELMAYRSVKRREEIYERLEKNDGFFMMDLASDRENPVYYEGCIVDKNKTLAEFAVEMLYGDGYAVPGMSGCGVFDEYGNYIAMFCGATKQGEIAAVPLTMVEEVYESIQ